LTNAHVARAGGALRVRRPGGSVSEAELIGTDERTDLAVVRARHARPPARARAPRAAAAAPRRPAAARARRQPRRTGRAARDGHRQPARPRTLREPRRGESPVPRAAHARRPPPG